MGAPAAPRPPPSCPPPPAADDCAQLRTLDAPDGGAGRAASAPAPAPPRHVLIQNCNDDDDDANAAFGITSLATSLSTTPSAPRQRQGPGRTERNAQRRARVVPMDPTRGYEETSKFWGVTWHIRRKLWQAYYKDKDDNLKTIG